MKRLIIVGSPRSNGRSAHLAEMLFEACIDECPDDEVSLAPVSELAISACVGCDGCKADEEHACVYDDDMVEIREILDEADELVVVSPVYFSGAPAPFKALLDRLQPYFWTWERGGSRRPLTLHIVGEGGTNPQGYNALIDEVRSACAVAGFRLERIVDWVGKINIDGTITAEGEEYVPSGRAVQFARIDANDIESIHVIHEENVRAARKANKKTGVAKQEGGKKQSTTAKQTAAKHDSGKKANPADQKPKLNIHSTNLKSGANSNHKPSQKGGKRG